eukprot:g957.t1
MENSDYTDFELSHLKENASRKRKRSLKKAERRFLPVRDDNGKLIPGQLKPNRPRHDQPAASSSSSSDSESDADHENNEKFGDSHFLEDIDQEGGGRGEEEVKGAEENAKNITSGVTNAVDSSPDALTTDLTGLSRGLLQKIIATLTTRALSNPESAVRPPSKRRDIQNSRKGKKKSKKKRKRGEDQEGNDDSEQTQQMNTHPYASFFPPGTSAMDNLLSLTKHPDGTITRTALLSLASIFSDILPSYRITSHDNEKRSRLSKEVAIVRDFEKRLLLIYKRYLQTLEHYCSFTKRSLKQSSNSSLSSSLISSSSSSVSTSTLSFTVSLSTLTSSILRRQTRTALVATTCAKMLLTKHSTFNFSLNLAYLLLSQMESRISEIANEAQQGLAELFLNEKGSDEKTDLYRTQMVKDIVKRISLTMKQRMQYFVVVTTTNNPNGKSANQSKNDNDLALNKKFRFQLRAQLYCRELLRLLLLLPLKSVHLDAVEAEAGLLRTLQKQREKATQAMKKQNKEMRRGQKKGSHKNKRSSSSNLSKKNITSIEAGLFEGQIGSGMKEAVLAKRAVRGEILMEVFTCFFRFIKAYEGLIKGDRYFHEVLSDVQDSLSAKKETDIDTTGQTVLSQLNQSTAKAGSSNAASLLQVVLRGILEFYAMVNAELVTDMVKHFQTMLDDVNLSVVTKIQLCQVSLTILRSINRGRGGKVQQILSYDPIVFVRRVNHILTKTSPSVFNNAQIISLINALAASFVARREFRETLVLEALFGIINLAPQLDHGRTIALIHFTVFRFLPLYPKVAQIIQTEFMKQDESIMMRGAGHRTRTSQNNDNQRQKKKKKKKTSPSPSYYDEPSKETQIISILWGLESLKRHWHPHVRLLVRYVGIVASKTAALESNGGVHSGSTTTVGKARNGGGELLSGETSTSTDMQRNLTLKMRAIEKEMQNLRSQFRHYNRFSTTRLLHFQSKCETFDNVGTGKYTKGLGQNSMAVVDPSEDIVSMAMTACSQLMEKNNLKFSDIGRLEVGTETIVDKSKSIKTHIMERFNEEGCYDVLGIDTINACYGGTSAFFNAVNWVESSMWNGKYAIVLTGDIAIYEKGPARPTGGAGMVAMLIGPDAPLVFESDTVVSHFEHAYDFYKPNMESEYPTVDGPLSNACYTRAIEACYDRFRKRLKDSGVSADKSNSHFDYALLHAPYQKLVRKAFHQVYEMDNPTAAVATEIDKSMGTSISDYSSKVLPGLALSNECGNMYTGSVWASLNSLLCNSSFSPSTSSRVMMFSYGSGFAASMFSMRVRDTKRIKGVGYPFADRLEARTEIEPSVYHAMVDARGTKSEEESVDYSHTSSTPLVAPGTFVRTAIDKLGRRSYQRMFHTLARRMRLTDKRDFRFALLLAGLAVVIRPTSVLMWLFLGLNYCHLKLYYTALARQLHRYEQDEITINPSLATTKREIAWSQSVPLRQYIAGIPSLLRTIILQDVLPIGGSVFLSSLLIDYCYYGKYTNVIYNFLAFNLLTGQSALYGTHPWYWYFTEGLTVILGGGGAGGTTLQSSQQHSPTPLPSPPIMEELSPTSMVESQYRMVGMANGPNRGSIDIARKWFLWFIYGLLFINLPIAYYTSRWHQAGPTATMDYLRMVTSDGNNDFGSNKPVHIVFLTDCHATPFYTHLHHGSNLEDKSNNVLLRFTDCSPPLRSKRIEKQRLEILGQYNSYLESGKWFVKDSYYQEKLRFGSGLKRDPVLNWHISADIFANSKNVSNDKDTSSYLPEYFVMWDTQIKPMASFLTKYEYDKVGEFFHSHVKGDKDDPENHGSMCVFKKNKSE